jgi:hypothetical protein
MKNGINKHVRRIGLSTLVALVAGGIALEGSQWLFRIRAKALLEDIKSLQVDHSSWADAQKLMKRWGRWGGWYGNCTAENCEYSIQMHHLSFTAPQFVLEDGPHLGARALELFGLRSSSVFARIEVNHGTLTSKGYGMSVALPVSRWITPEGGLWLQHDKIGSTYWPSIDAAFFEGVKLRGASSYTIAKHPNRGFIQRRIRLEASFTPEESPEEKAALMDFQLECLTRWEPCLNRKEILPKAEEEFEADNRQAF